MGTNLQWTQALAVGVEEVDEQHRELFRRAERLIAALRGGERAEVVPLLSFLEGYVVFHFEAEERLMRERRYPGLEAHAGAHKQFREAFAEMMARFHRAGPTALLALTVHNWLSDWLRSHIGDLDQQLGRWLAADRA
ncbi:MAG TPA: bacteriohemerythrin [Anaeromyxobacter sp.]